MSAMYAHLNPDGSADIYAGPPHGTAATAAPILTLPPAVVQAVRQATAPHTPAPYSPTPDASDYPDHDHQEIRP